jgi:hypothetical protein
MNVEKGRLETRNGSENFVTKNQVAEALARRLYRKMVGKGERRK